MTLPDFPDDVQGQLDSRDEENMRQHFADLDGDPLFRAWLEEKEAEAGARHVLPIWPTMNPAA